MRLVVQAQNPGEVLKEVIEPFRLPPVQERSCRKLSCIPANPRIPDVPSRSLEIRIIRSEGNKEEGNLWCRRWKISVFSPLPTEGRRFLARYPFGNPV